MRFGRKHCAADVLSLIGAKASASVLCLHQANIEMANVPSLATRVCCFSAGLCSACVNCLCVPDMLAVDTTLYPINAVPALMPSSGLFTAAHSDAWPLNTDDSLLLALRTVPAYPCCAAVTLVEVQSGTSMLR